MVSTASSYDFSAIIDGFFTSKKIRGPHAALITSTVRARALALLSHADVRYMPAFKLLDMIAALVNIGVAISEASQLRPQELKALLRESLSDDTKLIRQFMLEAALERARYEPLMLLEQAESARAERELILQRRWAAMRAAHQENTNLPDDWMEALDQAVERAITADVFLSFRHGPLLQMFAEMLALARKLQQNGDTLSKLIPALSEEGAIWKRYALKSARYREKGIAAPDLKTIQPPHTIH